MICGASVVFNAILFSVFINGLLEEVACHRPYIIGGMLFADDFVGVCDS